MFLDALFPKLRAAAITKRQWDNPAFWTPNMAGAGQVTTAGEFVSPSSAMTLPVYFACLRNISEDVGKLPFFVYKRTGPRSKERDKDHPLFQVLRYAPNHEMSANVWRQKMTMEGLGWGDGISEIIMGGDGRPAELWPIDPWRVTIKRDAGGNLVYEIKADQTRKGEVDRPLPPSRILHLPGYNFDGLRGSSVAKVAAQTLGLSMAAQTFASTFYSNGANFKHAVIPKDPIDDGTAKRQRKAINQFRGGYNAHNWLVLHDPVTIQEMGVKPEEAQFIETRQFQVEEFCRITRMPPHKVQHLLRATFSNIEEQSLEYVSDCLLPWIVKWEEEVYRKLFLPYPGWQDHFAEHLLTALMRGNAQARGAFYQILWDRGALSINDIREIENWSDIGPDGDARFVPLNMQKLEDAVAAKPEPIPEPLRPGMMPTDEPTDEDPEEDEEEEPDPPEEPEEEMAAMAREIFSPLFLNAAHRFLSKQRNALSRAHQKAKGDQGKFLAAAKAALDGEEEAFAEIFLPAVTACRAFCELEGEIDLSPWGHARLLNLLAAVNEFPNGFQCDSEFAESVLKETLDALSP